MQPSRWRVIQKSADTASRKFNCAFVDPAGRRGTNLVRITGRRRLWVGLVTGFPPPALTDPMTAALRGAAFRPLRLDLPIHQACDDVGVRASLEIAHQCIGSRVRCELGRAHRAPPHGLPATNERPRNLLPVWPHGSGFRN